MVTVFKSKLAPIKLSFKLAQPLSSTDDDLAGDGTRQNAEPTETGQPPMPSTPVPSTPSHRVSLANERLLQEGHCSAIYKRGDDLR